MMVGRCGRAVVGVLLAGFLVFFAPRDVFGAVFTAPLEGTVGVAMEAFAEDVLTRAAAEGAELVVFRLDSPGGLVTSMRRIVSDILESPVPVVVWVAPQGSRAASAGAFLLQAAHVAAMAPGTNVGAAHPVMASGKDVSDEEMSRKVTNDLSAQMRSLAQMRGRNAALAERMVSESLSFSAEEALGQGVADLLASDMRTLLLALRGRTVTVNGQDVELNPGDAVVDIDMTLRERVLHFISSPDVAYLLLTAGALAVIFEILSPGGFVLGTAGAVMVLMGAFGLRMLPFNWAGIVLLVAGVAVLVVDLLVGGIGILSLFGIAAIATAGLILFRTPGGELLNVSVHFIVGLSVALGLFFLLVLYLVLKSQRRQASSGREGMIGAPVEVLLDLAPDGQVKCHGEIWGGRSGTGRTMVRGATGRVVRVEGMTLVIEDDRQMEKNSKEEKEGSR